MSEQTTPEQSGQDGPQGSHEAPEPTVAPADDDARSTSGEAVPFWRKVPLWAWIVAGVVVIGGAVVGGLAASGSFDPEPLPTPAAATVTAEPPTPTAEPIERGLEPTAFSAVLPDTVLDLVLAEMAEGGRWAEGTVEPLETYTLTYSDGGAKNVTVETAQYADEETAQRAIPEVMADFETGEVTAGGVVVGEYWIVPAAEGMSTVMWRNSTAVFWLEGDDTIVRDVFRAFPL